MQSAWRRSEVSVEVVSDSGRPFRVIPHRRERRKGSLVVKQYLEARRGERYGIIIRNGTPGRVGVVIAVDGRNIISGGRSDLKNTEEMYLVDAYGTVRYDGWRTDRETVHRFYFTDPGDSYSVRTFGDASAMGVIAVAVYEEKERPSAPAAPLQQLLPSAPSAEGAPRDKTARREEAAGTGFGEARYAPVVAVEFEPEPVPFQRTLIKYEWRETLCRNGLLSCCGGTANGCGTSWGMLRFRPMHGEKTK